MTTRTEIKFAGICAVVALALAGCANKHSHEGQAHAGHTHGKVGMVTKAVAQMDPTKTNNVKGTVMFTKVDNGMRVEADLTGLTPGEHGFHIHEKGDCSAPDASSAGGHFNPTGAPHGGPDDAQHHIGDLGNITADSSGKAKLNRVFSFLTFEGTNSILGRGVIVHGLKDDLTSQPAGNAGPRLSCGVIKPK